jgi:hydroxypyruvate isomerase
MRRRNFITAMAAAATAFAQTPPAPVPRRGRLKQCAMRVNFDPKMSFDDMCRTAAGLGCQGFDLIGKQDWPTLRKYGLIPTMANSAPVTIQDGLIRKELHDSIEKGLHTVIDDCAEGGCPNIITVGGQRRGMSYAEGADNCVAILNRLKTHAEDKGVTICMEIMNSRLTPDTLGRLDQICDHVAWGIDVCKRVNSPRVKLLFDIYHVQIMDGDICRSIQQNFPWIGHFHTGGVPGRHELDDTQEINYRFVAKTIADLGYTGYVTHEYRPTPGRDPIQSLTQALEIMTV